MLPKQDLVPVGISEEEMNNKHISVSQNFPNPVNAFTSFRVEMDKAANLSMEVSNMIGQTVLSQDKGNVNAGTHEFRIDASELQAGIYFYTVIAGENRVTKRMIVR